MKDFLLGVLVIIMVLWLCHVPPETIGALIQKVVH